MSQVIEISEPSFELVEDLYTPGSFELVTAGQHNASLIQFEDFGMVMRTDFQTGKPMLGEDGEPIYRRECAVTFEVDEQDSNGRVKTIKRWMAYSVKNEKHALRMMLETWTGEKLTSGTVNMSGFLGKSATLQVLHKPKMDGSIKHVIDLVLPAREEYTPVNEIVRSPAPAATRSA